MSKVNLRDRLRARRRALSAPLRIVAALQAAAHLARAGWFQASEHIACYLASGEEFATGSLIDTIFQHDKKCYLPVVQTLSPSPLLFARYRQDDPLQLNRYGLWEPVSHAECIVPRELDMVLLPLVGFDAAGHRLGMGAGYYDKTFAFLHEPSVAQCKMVGVGFACQEIEAIVADAWDVPLAGVLTERGISYI